MTTTGWLLAPGTRTGRGKRAQCPLGAAGGQPGVHLALPSATLSGASVWTGLRLPEWLRAQASLARDGGAGSEDQRENPGRSEHSGLKSACGEGLGGEGVGELGAGGRVHLSVCSGSSFPNQGADCNSWALSSRSRSRCFKFSSFACPLGAYRRFRVGGASRSARGSSRSCSSSPVNTGREPVAPGAEIDFGSQGAIVPVLSSCLARQTKGQSQLSPSPLLGLPCGHFQG